MSKVQDQKSIDAVLSSEANSLTKMQNAIGKLLDANQQLKGSIELKQKVDALKKEAPSLPWFKRFVQIIPQVKYLFIKNDEQIAAEKREINREILTDVDDTLKKIGKKSSSLQVIIDTELQKGLDKILQKELSDEQKKIAAELQEQLSKLDISPEKFREIVPKIYNPNEAVALMHERVQLTQIQKDVTKLVEANDKVQGLLAIKQQLAKLQQGLPSTWLDGLKQVVTKIKHIFVTTPEKILENTVIKNNETLRHIDNALKFTGKNIESSKLARKDKLHKELEMLTKRKLSHEQSDAVKVLSSQIDLAFSKTISASEPLLTTIGQEQAQSQALHSSMPNLQTVPLRPAPQPPNLANASLPNQAVQQQNTIPQAPPLPPGGIGLQQAAGSIPRPTRPAPPPPSQLTHATSLQDINAPQPEEHARRASMPSSTKQHAAPPPPVQNLADPQPNIAAEIPPVPPAPPPPPLHVPGLQQGAHQEPQIIAPPPPLPPTAAQPAPPPLPGGFDQPLPPPPPPPPPPGQTNNPAAANPIEGQENRGQLLNEVVTGVTLKKVEIVDKKPSRDDMLAAIRASKDGGFKLKTKEERDKMQEARVKKVGAEKDGDKGEAEPALSAQEIFEKAMAIRRQAVIGNDDDDELTHAELVEFINNKDINASALISKLNTEDAQDITTKKELIKFIEKDFSDTWDDDDIEEAKQKNIVKRLNELKEKYENNALDLSAKSVVEVIATKQELTKELQAEVKAIAATIPKPENVTGANKPPPPPLPPKIRPVSGRV